MANKRVIIGAVAGLIGATFMVTGTASAEPPSCNWGRLTAHAIAAGEVEQGPHSADPSGDGHGPGTADEPRAGLANVSYALFGGDRGDLEATCVFIDGLLHP